jgi:hypothetical protein
MREKLLLFTLTIAFLFGGGILHSEPARTTGVLSPLWPSSQPDSCSDRYSEETAIAWVIPESCTIFSVAYDNTVLFGNNEDFSNPDTHYWVVPSEPGQLGVVYFGFDNLIPQGGINEKGLAFDTNGLPPLDLSPHPELSALPDGWIVYTFMRKAATVEEVVDMAKNHYRYNWGIPMKYQIFIADATGDAVVISVGVDGELAFTRKPEGDGFLISTNFNRANPDNHYGSYPCWRYSTAQTMLQELQDENSLTIDSFRSILDAVHVEGANTNTLYSNIFDLRNGMIYLYHWHQFDEVVILNVAEELARAPSPIRIRDLFSQKTLDQAEREHLRYQGKADAGVWKYVAKGWLFLTACCLAFVLLNMVFGTRPSIRILLAWGAITAVFGLVGWLAYLFSYRRSQTTRTIRQIALSATVCRVAVYVISLILAVLFFVYLQPNPGPANILVLTYSLPFIINLLILAAPHAAARLDIKYWVAVRRSALTELISVNLTFAGMFPTVFFLEKWWFPGPTDMGNPLLWFMMSVSAIVGVLILYPLNVWTTRRKFISWSIWLTSAQDTSGEHAALPSLQNAWVVLVLSFVLLVGSLGLMAW